MTPTEQEKISSAVNTAFWLADAMRRLHDLVDSDDPLPDLRKCIKLLEMSVAEIERGYAVADRHSADKGADERKLWGSCDRCGSHDNVRSVELPGKERWAILLCEGCGVLEE